MQKSSEIMEKLRRQAEEKQKAKEAELKAERERAAREKEAAEKRAKEERAKREAREAAEKARLEKEKKEREAREAAEKARLKKEKEEREAREAAERTRIEKEKVQKRLEEIQICLNEVQAIINNKKNKLSDIKNKLEKADKILENTPANVTNEPLYQSLKYANSELLDYRNRLIKKQKLTRDINAYSLSAILEVVLYWLWQLSHHIPARSFNLWVLVGGFGLAGFIWGFLPGTAENFFAEEMKEKEKEINTEDRISSAGGLAFLLGLLGALVKLLLRGSIGSVILIIIMSLTALCWVTSLCGTIKELASGKYGLSEGEN